MHSVGRSGGYWQDSPGTSYGIDSGDSKDIENQAGKSKNPNL
jgi:hypothetical protein